MRTTIRLDDELLRRAKMLAASTGKTLTAVIEDALREVLSREGWRGRSTLPKLPTFRGDGLRQGIDLDDSAGLIEVMESRR